MMYAAQRNGGVIAAPCADCFHMMRLSVVYLALRNGATMLAYEFQKLRVDFAAAALFFLSPFW